MWCGARNGRLPGEGVDRALPGGGGDDRRGQRSRVVERRQQPGDRPRQQRLARTRRTEEEEAVPAGEGDLEGPARLRLSPDLGEVRDGGASRTLAAGRSSPGVVARTLDELDPARRCRDPARSACPDQLDSSTQRLHAEHVHARRPGAPPRRRSPRRRPGGCRAAASAATIGSTPGTERTSPPSDSSPISADPPAARPQLFRAEQDPDRDREVERRAGLAQVGRREVDRDPPRRVDEAGVAERAADPLPGLLEGRVGEADDGEAGQSRRDVDLDPDEPPIEAVERRGRNDGQHAPQASRRRSPAGQRGLTAGSTRPHPDSRGRAPATGRRVSGWRPPWSLPRQRACRPFARTAGATRRGPNRPW